MTNRKKNILLIQALIFITAILLIYHTYGNKSQKVDNSNEIVAASDAFFPFVDGLESLIQSGVCAVIQPSGSINDKEIIKFADQTGTILVFSKTRHFNH